MFEFLLSISFPLFLIFLFAIATIFVIRIIIKLILSYFVHKYHSIKNKRLEKKYKKENLPNEDEILKSQKKEKEQKLSQLRNVERINSPAQEFEQNLRLQDKGKVVDIAKPIGFWTSLILGQKLTYLVNRANVINSREQKGFWVSMMEAQSRGMGRKKGRGI